MRNEFYESRECSPRCGAVMPANWRFLQIAIILNAETRHWFSCAFLSYLHPALCFAQSALKMRVHRAGAAEFARQRLPLATAAQYIYVRGKDMSGGHRRAPCTRLAAIQASNRSSDDGDKWFHLGPKRIRNSLRLDLRHLGTHFRPVCTSQRLAVSHRESSRTRFTDKLLVLRGSEGPSATTAAGKMIGLL